MYNIILTSLLLILPMAPAQAQVDLETDDSFFDSIKSPYEEDDLDKSYRNHQKNKPVEAIKDKEITEKSEIGSTSPQMMSKTEAAYIDQKMIEEDKRRKKAIFNTISSNRSIVKSCIEKNKKDFQGSQITVAWMIGPKGNVLNAEVRSSDFNSPETQACVQLAAQQLDFSAAAFDQYKKSLVEYTYKVTLKQARKPASMKRARSQRRK
jgi:hypothetical protein